MRNFSVLDISLHQIQLFLTVAEVRNFSRAATRMHMTETSLSEQISLLEESIGVKLLDREKLPQELTPSGKILYKEWLDIYSRFEHSIEHALDGDQRTNKKLIVSSMASTRHLMAIHLSGQQLEQNNAGVTFLWEYNSFMKWRNKLREGEIDLMLAVKVEAGGLDSEMQCEQVMACPKLVCMLKTNPLSKKESITYKDLRNQQFIVIAPGSMSFQYDYVRKICRDHGGFRPKVVRYAPHPHALIGSLQNDNEVVICDLFLRDIDSPLVKTFPLPDTHSGMIAIWQKDNPNPYIRPYIENLKNNFIKHYPAVLSGKD